MYYFGTLTAGVIAAYTCADGSPIMKQTCINCDLPKITSCDMDRYYGYTLEQ